MGKVYTTLPYNPQFDYDEFEKYIQDIMGPTIPFDPLNFNCMRLPGNTDIFTFLLYCGKLFNEWWDINFPNTVDTPREKPVFTPEDPDTIYSLSNVDSPNTQDSPHTKIPPVISFVVKRKEPASMTGGKMFGTGKHWKFRTYGDIKASDGNIYRLRSRFWESLVEFQITGRSGLVAEQVCSIFEKFMDLTEGKFLEAGLTKMVPRGRLMQKDMKLENSKLKFRTTYFYFRTQEFQFAGPITPISDVDITAYPT